MTQSSVAVSTSGPGQESVLNPTSEPKASAIVTETAVMPTPQVEAEADHEPTSHTERLEAVSRTDNSPTAAPAISFEEVAAKEGAAENETKLDATSTQKDRGKKAEPSPNEDEKSVTHSNADAEAEDEEEEEGEAGKHETPKRKPKIPHVRKVNFEGFKNRFSQDEDEYALDVLVAGNDLMDEIRREQQTRQNYQIRQERRLEKKRTKSPKVASKASQGPIPRAAMQPKEGGWIQRVRIQSHAILHHLSKVTGESWNTESPRTFNRPFSVFIYFQDQMKEVLTELQSRWGEEEQRQQAMSVKEKSDVKADDSNDKANGGKEANDLDDRESTHAMAEGVEALRDVRCYVGFVEEEIMPLAKQFEGIKRTKVRFDDLWFLFKVGDMVCAPGAMVAAAPGSKSSAMYQPLWRVYTLNRPTDPFQYPTLESKSKPRPPESDDSDDDDGDGGSTGQFKVWAYYIDHDGTSYGAVKHRFAIPRYPGEREIAKLPCYPLRYLDDWETHLEELKALGKKFEFCMTNTHLSYNGWTLISTPDGESMTTSPDRVQRQLHSEYIDSHVVVDFAEAFHQAGNWKPTFHRPTVYVDAWESQDDDFPVMTWSDEQRSDLVEQTIMDVVQVVDGVTMWQRKDGLEMDKFLKASSKLSLKSGDHSRVHLGDEDCALLSRRMFAYVLKDRKFVCVDVQYLNEIPPQNNVFKNLKINNEYKQMVKGLVRSHLAKKELEMRHPGASKVNQSQDIIYGKGRGLVILLHGVPGVGKTATAEAVALEYQKPLFVITCGDLGLTPKEVEESLTEIFRLAHLWHCVLLFDEADVFLAQRSRFDLTRNALVSVFLRILEYYNGILFLTTNRVGTLDEAFKSRIHMSLYYPPLDTLQVKLIFKMNLEKLVDIERERQELTGEPALDINLPSITNFATEHCVKTESEGGRWNGRQIRNAFQIASSLARYHALEDYENELAKGKDPGPRRPVLDDTQFKKVERATEAFKDYLEKAKGYNDADLAHILGERDDFYRQGKLFGGMAGAAAAGYPGAGGEGPGVPYPGGQYGQGMPPEHGAGGTAPNMEFPAMRPGPMAYGHNENSRPPAASHGGGPNIFQTPPHSRAGLNLGQFHTPPTGGSQGRSDLDPFVGNGRQQGYGHNANSGQNYSGGAHPLAYNHRLPQAPPQSQAHTDLDESTYD